MKDQQQRNTFTLPYSETKCTASHLQELIDGSTGIICLLHKDGRIISATKALGELLGYCPLQLANKQYSELCIATERIKTSAALEAVIQGSGNGLFENTLQHKDGSLVFLNWLATWNAHEEMLICIGSVALAQKNELQDTKSIEKKSLSAPPESLVLEQIHDGFFAADRNSNVTYWNKEAERFSSVRKEEIVGKNLWENFPEAKDTTLYQSLDKLLDGTSPVYSQIYYYPLHLWFAVTAYPSEEGYSVYFKDITEQKKLQERLEEEEKKKERAIARAVDKARQQDRALLGKELHDNVNQILTTVKLYNELCLQDEAQHKELLKKSITYLNLCIEEIRGLTRNLTSLSPTDVPLHTSISDLVDSIVLSNKLCINYTAYNIEDKVFNPDVHIAVYRIVQEALTNVLKHAAASSITLKLWTEEKALHLYVEDDGTGFDKESVSAGMGLKNMISRTEVVNGTIHIDTAPGRGCRLSVTIPYRQL